MKRLHTYSQNFLRSPRLIEGLVHRSTLGKDDTVYDIGAGSGVISSVLAPLVKKVVAVEYDPRVAEVLRKNMARFSNVEVIEADYSAVQPPKGPYKVFANIPFHLSSPIVRSFLNAPHSPEAVYLIVQKQFGKKLVATDTSHFTSQLGMCIGAEYRVRVAKSLQKTDFSPPPAVDTVYIEMIKRKEPLVNKSRLAAYIRFTEECFSDPKKLAKMPLEVIGMEPGGSPSRVSLERWILLFHSQTKY